MITQENIPYTADEIKAMVKTIEELGKKYNRALERAKYALTTDMDNSGHWAVNYIFPELKESEDERIRKGLVKAFGTIGKKDWGGLVVRDVLAWLENQGNVDKASYEIAEREKHDFVSGQFIECRKSFNEFKELNSYWFEYVGNDTYIGRSDNILNQKFHITPRQLYCLFTQQHYPKENDVNEETKVPTGYGKYVDECLYEAAEHFFSEGEDKYSVADLFYAGVRCGKSCPEKQGEQPTDKVEPKFKVEDWIIPRTLDVINPVYCITGIAEDRYIVAGQYGNISNIPFETEELWRLWTIQDAKDGDVLVNSKGQPFIFSGKYDDINSGNPIAYCGVNRQNKFKIGNGTHWTNKNEVAPATKEQCGRLFSKMKQEGYEWDSEKKELKTIEQKSSDEVEPKFKVGVWVVSDNNGEVWQIGARYTEEGQRIYLYNVNYVMMSITLDELNNDYHLWTIQDAKDGDVLVNGSNIFIFHFINDTRLMGYCHVNIDDERFYDDIGKNECFCLIDAEVTPATKEQRELLFAKMRDSGYEWDAEKKELKKIEPKKLNADEVIGWLNHRELSCDDVVTTVIPDDSPTSVRHRVKWLSDEFIKQFKKDFGL